MINWMSITMVMAGIYNILWGSWVVLFPNMAFEFVGAELPNYPQIWQCVGMIVAVYGLGYLISATSIYKHWPIILVGFLGKVFGPIGFVWSIYQEIFPITFGFNIIFNDLIWWIPFALILKKVWDSHVRDLSPTTIKESEFNSFEERKRAKLINSLSGIKSINLIGTTDGKSTNLSIVSSVFHLGSSPALLGFIIRPDSARRDTLNNIRKNGKYTINHVNKSIVEKAHQTSARFDECESEFSECQLTEQYLEEFKAPFVAESHIKMAVEFVREVQIVENGTHMIIGRIIDIHLPKESLGQDGNVNIIGAGTISGSGLDCYSENTIIGRLSYAKKNIHPRWS